MTTHSLCPIQVLCHFFPYSVLFCQKLSGFQKFHILYQDLTSQRQNYFTICSMYGYDMKFFPSDILLMILYASSICMKSMFIVNSSSIKLKLRDMSHNDTECCVQTVVFHVFQNFSCHGILMRFHIGYACAS